MKRFENKVALVTGAASGIGLSTAERLAAEGAKVVLADMNIEGAKGESARLNGMGYDTRAVFFQAADEVSGREIVRYTVQEFGGIDVLVNNAAHRIISRDLDLLHADISYFDDIFHINVRSMMLSMQEAIPYMQKAGGGSIVCMASVGGITGDTTGCFYGMTKASVINLVKYVATQYGDFNIRCNAVAPGLVLTPAVTKSLSEDFKQTFIGHNALPYAGEDKDIAATVAFLASDDARYITGITIVADGGQTCHNPSVKDQKAQAIKTAK